MTAEDFCAWLLRTGLSKRAAARALGVSESYVRAMSVGVRAVPESIADACDGIEHNPPADVATLESMREAGPPAMPQFTPAPTMADLDSLRRRIGALERPVRALQQRVAELTAAFEEAGLPLRQGPIPMTDDEREEADLRLLKAQRLEEMQRAAKPAPGALTDDERAEADRARRMIAKARTLANGEPWE